MTGSQNGARMKEVRHFRSKRLQRGIDLFIQGTIVKGMSHVCTLNADLSSLAGALQPQDGKKRIFKKDGKPFYRVDYDVCVYFGGTQLRAKLQWMDNVSTFASLLASLLTN
jgi:hypothetical protein